MARDDGGVAGTVFVAFVLGAVTGAAVALLLAPASGEETRRILAEKAKEGARKGQRRRAPGEGIPQSSARHPRHGDRARAGRLYQARSGGAAGSAPGTICEHERDVPRHHRAATLLMALIQVGAIVAILRVARQAQQTLAEVQRDVPPLIAKVTAVADEASRTATLATVQAEKIDQLLTDLTQRIDETAGVVQQAIITPAREGMAIVAALKAGLGGAARLPRRPRHGRAADEEDPLFIG